MKREPAQLSMRRRCELLDVNRSMLYYEPVPDTEETLELMRLMMNNTRRLRSLVPAEYERSSKRRAGWSLERGSRRLMKKMALEAIYPKPKTSNRNVSHTVYPYLLRGLTIDKPDQSGVRT